MLFLEGGRKVDYFNVVSAAHSLTNVTLYFVQFFVTAPYINLWLRPKGHISLGVTADAIDSTSVTTLHIHFSFQNTYHIFSSTFASLRSQSQC